MLSFRKDSKRLVFILAAPLFLITSCQSIDLYEKNVAIPKHQWSSNFKPRFNFTISDTNSAYQLFVVIRHDEKYNWNNIWLNLEAGMPGSEMKKFKVEIPLATTDKGWLGSAMDDIYEQRIPILLDPDKFNFGKAGTYQFTISQIMREEPLQHVMNIGLRVEKKNAPSLAQQ